MVLHVGYVLFMNWLIKTQLFPDDLNVFQGGLWPRHQPRRIARNHTDKEEYESYHDDKGRDYTDNSLNYVFKHTLYTLSSISRIKNGLAGKRPGLAAKPYFYLSITY